MSIIQGNAHTSAGGGYQIERSLRFNSADSAYLNRTLASAGNRKTWTWSGWVKRSALNVGTYQGIFSALEPSGSTFFYLLFDTSTSTIWVGQGAANYRTTSSVYRDTSAWYHIVLAVDTTQATAANRIKLYVNGVQVTAFSASSDPTLNQDLFVNAASSHTIGSGIPSGSPGYYNDGYMTEVNFIDGQALTPSSFGETDTNTGVWKPKAYSGTYGTNGFFLKFADNSGTTSTTLGKDSSGNGNNWTPNNFSVTAGAGNDSLVDSPTSYGTDTGAGGEVRGNYCTLNPLAKGAGVVLSDGNLGYTSNATYRVVLGSIAVASGKYYWEVTAPSNAYAFGVADVSYKIFDSSILATGNLFSYSSFSGDKYIGLSFTQSSYDTSGGISTSTVLGFAVDFDTGTATIYRNGVSKGVIHTWTPGATYAPFAGYDTTPSGVAYFNFGQRAFAYTAPSGFKALCTQNLPTPTIGATSTTQANDYFNVVLYTGAGSGQSITGVGFAPDFIWQKERSSNTAGGSFHYLSDKVRGVNAILQSNTTGAESTGTDVGINTFDSDGFTMGTYGGGNANQSGESYVAWNWKANGAGSTNTAGTITSTVSANTTSGFSIVTYTGNKTSGATIGHGLGVAPAMVIIKERANASEWIIYHQSLGATQAIYFTTAAANTNSIWFNNTAPSSTVITLGNSDGTNRANTMIAYAFAPVAGYSAFGSYTGNGSTDGPFVFTNFRPRFILWKRSDGAESWWINDTSRLGYNGDNRALFPNLSNAENTANNLDILSNGFKIRGSGGEVNASGGTYIYAAFAETPFRYSLAR